MSPDPISLVSGWLLSSSRTAVGVGPRSQLCTWAVGGGGARLSRRWPGCRRWCSGCCAHWCGGHYTHCSARTVRSSRRCAYTRTLGAGSGGSPSLWWTVGPLAVPARNRICTLTCTASNTGTLRWQPCALGCAGAPTARPCTSCQCTWLCWSRSWSTASRTWRASWCGAWPRGSPTLASTTTKVFSREIIPDWWRKF